MANQPEWTIVFYTTANGGKPVQEWLVSLDQKTQARFEWSIEQLRARNVHAGEPLVKHIQGKIWELRRASDGDIYRLMYFFFTGRKIVFLHGFQKKTSKTPRGDIEIAQSRMEDFVQRQEDEEGGE
jgi:phage-related protein